MLRQILALTWKDLKVFFKDRGAVVMIFVQPFMFILVMSYALSGLYRTGDRPIQILAVNQDKGNQAAAILHQLDEMKAFSVETTWEGQLLTHQKVEQLIIEGKRKLALIFPPDFSAMLEQDPAARGASNDESPIYCGAHHLQPVCGAHPGDSSGPPGADRLYSDDT